jgi:hypothetical protein
MMVKIKKSVNPIVNLQVIQPVVPSLHTSKACGSHVRRIDDEPNMFYSVKIDDDKEEKEVKNPRLEQPKDTNINNVFLIAKTALNINYVVIITCLINTPVAILSIIYCNCDPENGDCHVFLIFNKISIPLKILAIFGGCLIIFFKTKKSDDI